MVSFVRDFSAQSVAVGGQVKLDSATTLKGKLESSWTLLSSVEHTLRSFAKLSIFSKWNAKDNSKPAFGVELTLGEE